ncbi:hypothetical protein SAMN05192555_101371 [Franzmannia pantelleriensis]|uniref:Phasin protein n=1 Tax=Franzmannia pantelleriensis TaxID=48727 RepID=A0A1G9FCR4_9GAMM|nr:hypothetical protein [Halomonas pantelleriensis]SDK86178.1 hypothetical protein SAMN05192555_101371 [Halomonas pantelleriensis]
MSPTPTHQSSTVTPLPQLWLEQWLDANTPTARLQLQWLKAMDQMIESEATFMLACLNANLRMSECLLDPDRLTRHAELSDCYQEIMTDVTEASMARLSKVTELSREFREQLWEEL